MKRKIQHVKHTYNLFIRLLEIIDYEIFKKVSPSTIDVAHTDLGILKILNTAFFYYSEKIISKRLLKTVQLKCNIAVLTDPFVIWSKVRYFFYFLNHRMKQIWLLLTPCFNLNNRDCLNMTKENQCWFRKCKFKIADVNYFSKAVICETFPLFYCVPLNIIFRVIQKLRLDRQTTLLLVSGIAVFSEISLRL